MNSIGMTNDLAATFGTYGIYTLIACLVVAIIYLYRRTNELSDRMNEQIALYAKQSAEIAAKTTEALKESSEVIRQIKEMLMDRR